MDRGFDNGASLQLLLPKLIHMGFIAVINLQQVHTSPGREKKELLCRPSDMLVPYAKWMWK